MKNIHSTQSRPSRVARYLPGFSKNRMALIGALTLMASVALPAQSRKKAADFRFPAAAAPLTLQSGGSADFSVDAIVPANNHIYLKHANEISLNILTEFRAASPGWAVAVEEAPAGKRYKDDFILTGRGAQPAGTYKMKLYETKGRAPGPRLHTVKVEIKTQMCNSKTNVCYRPATMIKQVRARVNAKKTRTALPKHRGGVAWVQSYDKAVSKARASGRNIFVVITAPEWCGYCKVLERKVFAKSAVAKRLNQKFVPLQLLDTNRDRNKFRFDGYPTMLIAGATGKKVAEVYGRDENSFLAAIKKYEKGGDDSGDDSNDGDAQASYNFSIQLKGEFRQTKHGWERRVDGGQKVEKFTEHRRSKSYIILKNKATGQYIALPIKGGKGLIYRNSAWEHAFDVSK